MDYFKKFSDEEIINIIKNYTFAYTFTTNEEFIERVEQLFQELDKRENNK